MTAWLLVATPCFLSWSSDYFTPFEWFGCLSLVYSIYLTAQTCLIIAALTLAYLDVPFHTVWRPFDLLPKGIIRPIFLRSGLVIFSVLTGGAALAAALSALVGSVFQFTDLFETCICAMPVSYWKSPASQRPAYVNIEFTSQDYQDYFIFVNTCLHLSAAGFTCVVCFLGWWYQRALRVALKDVIESFG